MIRAARGSCVRYSEPLHGDLTAGVFNIWIAVNTRQTEDRIASVLTQSWHQGFLEGPIRHRPRTYFSRRGHCRHSVLPCPVEGLQIGLVAAADVVLARG